MVFSRRSGPLVRPYGDVRKGSQLSSTRASYNILSRYVGSRLRKPTVCARPSGHRRQMEAQSRDYPYGMGECDGSPVSARVVHALKIIN